MLTISWKCAENGTRNHQMTWSGNVSTDGEKIPNLPRIIRHFLIPSIRNSSDKMGVNLQRNSQPLQKTMWQIDFRDLSLSSWPERKFPRTVLPTLQERHLMTVYWDCFQKSVPKKVSMILSSLKKQMTCIIPISGNRVQPWEVPWSLMLRWQEVTAPVVPS